MASQKIAKIGLHGKMIEIERIAALTIITNAQKAAGCRFDRPYRRDKTIFVPCCSGNYGNIEIRTQILTW